MRISIAVTAILCFNASLSHGAKKTPIRQLLPTNDLVVIEAPNGTAFLRHPVIQGIRSEVVKSAQWKAAQTSPQFDRLRLISQLIEKATGKSWSKGLEQLTAGGVAASFTSGNQGGLTLIVEGKDAASIKRSVATIQDFVKLHLPEPQRDRLYVPVKQDGVEYVRVGNAAYALADSRFVFGSTVQRLRAALKRGRNGKPATSSNAKSTALRVSVDMRAVRKIPGFLQGLQFPGKDAGQIALLGGWIDLLRRAERMETRIETVSKSIDITLRSSASPKGSPTGLAGFFADGKTHSAKPLLNVPAAIYAASWYRDYRSLWDNRRRLITAAAAKKLEEGDNTLKQQFSVIGGKTAPSRWFSLLGPHFRVVVTRQPKLGYQVELESKLPTAALAVDLRDEAAFRNDVTPFLRGIGLILSFQEKLQTKKTTYRGAALTTLRFPDDEASASTGNRIRYNFAPTYCIARKHFLIGSTPGIVRQIIDELDRQKNSNESRTEATEIQRLSLKEAVAAMKDFEWEAIRGLVMQMGFDVNTAKLEVNVLKRILQQVGDISTRSGFARNGFEYRIRIHGK